MSRTCIIFYFSIVLGQIITFIIYAAIGILAVKAEIYGTVILKMCIFPIVFFYLLKLIPGITQDIAVTMSVLSALPTMTSIAMLAQIQKSADEYSAGMIFVTTLFSIVTLPFVCLCIG